MNVELQAELVDAVRQLQSLTGETVEIAGLCYSCTAADMVRGSLDWFQGGAANMRNVPICVLQLDLNTPPAINTIAMFRGNRYRIKNVDDAAPCWQLGLVQELA